MVHYLLVLNIKGVLLILNLNTGINVNFLEYFLNNSYNYI